MEIKIPEGEPGWVPENAIDVEDLPEPVIAAAASDASGSPAPSSPIGDQFNNFSSQTTQCHGSSNISSQSTVAANRESEEPQRQRPESVEPERVATPRLEIDPVTEASYIASQIAELRVRSSHIESISRGLHILLAG